MLLTKLILKSFKKKRKESSSCHALLWSCFHALLCFDLAMLLLTKSAPTKRQKISALQLIPHVLETKRRNSLFSHYSPITIHPLLFMTLFTQNFAYLRGLSLMFEISFSSSLLSWREFLVVRLFLERIPCFPISLQSLGTKACN